MTSRKLALALALVCLLGSARASAQASPATADLEPQPETSGKVGVTAAEQPAASSMAEPAPMLEVEQMSDAELGALGLDAEDPGVDTSFHFSGFADFTASKAVGKNDSTTAALNESAFYIGNLNLYLSKNLTESFRTMAEVRLTYLPNGALYSSGTSIGYETTQTADYANGTRTTRWGGIIMQRVYLEWSLHRLLAVRMGQFLTPYGVWNVDHGSPVYIPATRPYATNNDFFPERQTGFELFGRWEATNRNTLGYHLTFSNGTGPFSEYRDLDENKAVGVRTYWEFQDPVYVRIGFSGYYGRDTSSTPTARIVDGTAVLKDNVLSQYDNLALGADYQLKFKQWLVQGEWISQQRRFTREGRAFHQVVLGPVAEAVSADSFSWAAYQLLAYRFKWYGLTPFVMGEFNHQVLNTLLPDGKVQLWNGHVGLNVWPADSVVFKFEYKHQKFVKPGVELPGALDTLLFQAAWAF